jgi:quinoprotein glucose dehydrogenase
VPQTLSPDEAWGLTAADRQGCREKIASLRSEGVFTPPGLDGIVAVPGNVGGIHWGGMAWDAEREILVTPVNRVPFEVRLIARDQFETTRRDPANQRFGGEFASMSGTPYGMFRAPLFGPNRMLCSPPPWGALTAVDFTKRRVSWNVPLGYIPQLAAIPDYKSLGSFNLGGAMVTGGLVFVGATLDPHLHAFDIESGTMLWEGELPTTAQATPMTYELDGKQYIVIAAGGHGKLGTKLGDSVVAFAVE